jgi:hypothetical protein
MKANLLDDGIGDTLVSRAFDDVTLISHGKRVNLRTGIKELNLELSIGNGDVGERTFVGIWSSDTKQKPSGAKAPGVRNLLISNGL